MVLLGNHGIVAIGGSADAVEAITLMTVKGARTRVQALSIGGVVGLGDDAVSHYFERTDMAERRRNLAGAGLMAELAAVFCDVGGPIYDDENFVRRGARGTRRAAGRCRGRLRSIAARSVNSTTPAAPPRGVRCASRWRWSSSATVRGAASCTSATKAHWVHPAGTMYSDVLPFLQALAGRVTARRARKPGGRA